MKSINFKKDKIFIFSLITLILLATFFRLNNLNYDDLWTDEIFSFWVSDLLHPISTIDNRMVTIFFIK